MTKTIYFDMDGTIVNFYGVDGWLQYLMEADPTPYKVAEPLLKMNVLARTLNRLQREGYKLGIISWLAKSGTPEYDKVVTETKVRWLHNHLRSVQWDEIHIVKYGTPKHLFATENDILFDDESGNREAWKGQAYDVDIIMEVLRGLM